MAQREHATVGGNAMRREALFPGLGQARTKIVKIRLLPNKFCFCFFRQNRIRFWNIFKKIWKLTLPNWTFPEFSEINSHKNLLCRRAVLQRLSWASRLGLASCNAHVKKDAYQPKESLSLILSLSYSLSHTLSLSAAPLPLSLSLSPRVFYTYTTNLSFCLSISRKQTFFQYLSFTHTQKSHFDHHSFSLSRSLSHTNCISLSLYLYVCLSIYTSFYPIGIDTYTKS